MKAKRLQQFQFFCSQLSKIPVEDKAVWDNFWPLQA